MKTSILSLIAVLGTIAAQASSLAATVVITDTRCVPASIDRAHKWITNYEDYSNQSKIPGARYAIKLPVADQIPLLTMIKSQARFAIRSETRTDGFTWVVLQPTNLTDQNVYPKFLLHCTSSIDSPDHFSHKCSLDKTKPHYGLDDFQSTLEANGASAICGSNKTMLTYRLTLESNTRDVDAIKNAATAPLGRTLGPAVASLFNEDRFFRSYYVNFYDSWAKALEQ